MKVPDLSNEALLIAPPAGVSAATIFGIPVASWVLYLNLFYIVLLICIKVYNLLRKDK